ncbi:hypothetical protein LguiB_030116 [Lonicera macranthoides]
MDFVNGLDRYLTSGKSADDPSPGNFMNQIDPNGYLQLLLRVGSVVHFRSKPWNGLQFLGHYKNDVESKWEVPMVHMD